MSDAAVHVFNHQAMATLFQARIAGEDRTYAGQAARAAFDIVDRLEAMLSRFNESSEISRANGLLPGESMRLSEPVFACLEIARRMESATDGAFSANPAALRSQPAPPRWTLLPQELSIRCDGGRLELDLGGIGKGFALDRMAEELPEWECGSFLLIAGGSSILAGDPPPGTAGWSAGLGENEATRRLCLAHRSLSGSGIAVRGQHIVDPRTGKPAGRRQRVWALANTAAESDAISTAAMVLDDEAIGRMVARERDWEVWLERFGPAAGFAVDTFADGAGVWVRGPELP